MALLDESLAAVAGGEVEEFVIVEEIFCQLFSACEHAQDVRRAEQWIRVGEQIAERRGCPRSSAYCRTHYGGILTAAGRWPEADVALTEAVRLWALGRRSLKAGALIRLADLGSSRDGTTKRPPCSTARPTTSRSGRGPRCTWRGARSRSPSTCSSTPSRRQTRTAARASRCSPSWSTPSSRAAKTPHDTIERMAGLRRRRTRRSTPRGLSPSPAAGPATATRRRGSATRSTGSPRSSCRSRRRLCRLDLARACSQANPEVAIAEARAALKTFEMLEAARYVDATAAVLRELGQKVAPPRTSGRC